VLSCTLAGELALLHTEPCPARVTVMSDTAKCLRITKAKFDEILLATSATLSRGRAAVGRDVIDKVPLFQSLSVASKTKLVENMEPVRFKAGSYICRQGDPGNMFYIITDGSCYVRVSKEDGTQRDVSSLHASDFFGESSYTWHALIHNMLRS
jgi:CRP-like cAMP-binding protein